MKFKTKITFLIFIPFLIAAQSSTSYTRFGIGDIEYTFTARAGALGNLNTAYNDGAHLTILNPASWNKITRTRLEISSKYDGVFLSNASNSKYFGNAEFGGFAFGFPVSELNGIGAAMGLVPYSNISYHVKESALLSTNEEYITNYEGKGGLSKFFIGTSYRMPFGLSIGATFDYYFGNFEYLSQINFTSSNLISTEYKKTFNPKGIGSTIGLISPDLSSLLKSEIITDLRLGASVSIISNLTTDTSLIKSSSVLLDTIGNGVVDMKVPMRLNLGFNVALSHNYLLNMDYAFQPWSEYSFNGIKSSNLRDAYKVSAGFEYRPSKELGSTFWEQMVWRAGLSFEQTQYQINGTGINQYSVGGGFGLPMGSENSLDISIQYSTRGTTESNLLKEDRITLNLGFSLGEVWFIRQEK